MIALLDFLRDMPLLAKAVVMGVVEGVTEFLPVSSTGHLILAGALIGFDDDRAKVFDIAIQTGAMVAVIWNYRIRFAVLAAPASWRFIAEIPSVLGSAKRRQTWWHDPSWQFLRHLGIAFLPAAIVGLIFGSWIKSVLFFPVPVAVVLILGGLVILGVERWVRLNPAHQRILEVDQLNNMDALKLGIAQSFALIPGTSRSGATIIGGMIFGLSRKAATEFSFFLAVPTLVAAGAYDLLKNWRLLRIEDLPLFGAGLLVSYVSALLVVRWLIRFVSRHSFNGFAVYRILSGAIVLLAIYFF